jgi:type II secretory pathway component PulK
MRARDASLRPQAPPQSPSPSRRRDRRRSEGIALLIVLVIVMLLVTAVYLFQRRAVINTTIARNRVAAAEADALARGGLRIAEAALFLIRLREEQELAASGGAAAGAGGDAEAAGAPGLAALLGGSSEPWRMLDGLPIDLEQGQSLQLRLEDAGARLNLNALVPATVGEGEDSGLESSLEDHEEAILYLTEVLDYIVAGIEAPPADRVYDTREIAESLIDWMDEDGETRSGRSEDDAYARQDPPYRARNGPFLSFEEIGLVEGVDPQLLDAMRDYLTVHPIGGTAGINLNTAPPWVLKLVYAGTSGDRRLLTDDTVQEIWRLREQEDKILCEDSGGDPERCVSLSEARIEGSIYPETTLPSTARVFRVVAEARVGALTRRMEAIVDTRSLEEPQLLSWRRLRGAE